MTSVFKNKISPSIGTQLAVTSVTPSSPSSGSVTLSFAAQSVAPFTAGQSITVTGISVSGYNGTFTVVSCTTSSVTFSNSTTGAATGGVITLCVLTTNALATTTVLGLSITNTTPNVILASIQINDTVANTTGYFISQTAIPPNQSLRVVNGGERLVLGPSTNVLVTSNNAASMDLIMSWVEIS
jgi:hypothetical protein